MDRDAFMTYYIYLPHLPPLVLGADCWQASLDCGTEGEMKEKELNFEQALAELEKAVEKLETGGLSLSESLALFEKGVKLARFLRAELDKAEKKVEILLKDEKGEVHAEPFDVDEDAGDAHEGEEGGEGEGEAGGTGAPSKKARSRTARKKSEGGDDTLPF